MKTTFTVAAEDEGLRLDQVIPRHVDGLSRRKARGVIDLGGVFVNRSRVKVAGRLVQPGQVIEVNVGSLDRATAPPPRRIGSSISTIT
ncbi:MAG: S4 domain-containing protein [Kofleriaceae bacterium]